MNKEGLQDRIYKEFMSILKRHIPDSMIESSGYSAGSFSAKLSGKNKSFIGTDYFFDKGKKFVHWTSVQNLLSILNYREFRLYNLHNSSDENEFKYPSQKFNVTKETIDYSKSYLTLFHFVSQKKLIISTCGKSMVKTILVWP